MRSLALVAGAALVVLAFGAATRVADTREGLVAEVVTLFAALGGISLLIYGLAARKRPAPARPQSAPAASLQVGRRSNRDLLLGTGGLALAVILLAGLAFSGGLLWAALGLALMLPMLGGSVYLCVRYLRTDE